MAYYLFFTQALEKSTEDLNKENEALKAKIDRMNQNLEQSIAANFKLEDEIKTTKQENNARFAKLESLLLNNEIVANKE